MTSILVALMLTVCTGNECHEYAEETWIADSTNALTIALEDCDYQVKVLEQETGDYYRCTIGKE